MQRYRIVEDGLVDHSSACRSVERLDGDLTGSGHTDLLRMLDATSP